MIGKMLGASAPLLLIALPLAPANGQYVKFDSIKGESKETNVKQCKALKDRAAKAECLKKLRQSGVDPAARKDKGKLHDPMSAAPDGPATRPDEQSRSKVKAPDKDEKAGLLLPAVQKVRDSAPKRKPKPKKDD